MIYLEETLNLSPATPMSLDGFIDFAKDKLLPGYPDMGARLSAAWYSDVEYFHQVTQLLEFDDLSAFADYQKETSLSSSWQEIEAELSSLAPVRRYRLLEPLVPEFAAVFNKAIVASRDAPLKTYMLAILEVAPGQMQTMVAGLAAVAATGSLPIVMSFRPVTGNPNEVIDVWKGSLQQAPYQPMDSDGSSVFTEEVWTNLRIMAPQERIAHAYTLPYSPLG